MQSPLPATHQLARARRAIDARREDSVVRVVRVAELRECRRAARARRESRTIVAARRRELAESSRYVRRPKERVALARDAHAWRRQPHCAVPFRALASDHVKMCVDRRRSEDADHAGGRSPRPRQKCALRPACSLWAWTASAMRSWLGRSLHGLSADLRPSHAGAESSARRPRDEGLTHLHGWALLIGRRGGSASVAAQPRCLDAHHVAGHESQLAPISDDAPAVLSRCPGLPR